MMAVKHTVHNAYFSLDKSCVTIQAIARFAVVRVKVDHIDIPEPYVLNIDIYKLIM